MSDGHQEPAALAALALVPVANEETLARYILFSKWVRADNTVRPDAFIPYPYPDLSVTCHAGISDERIWEIGKGVAQERGLTLYGRADVLAGVVRAEQLDPVPAPTAGNANHINIVGWPASKAEQKSRAQKLAAAAPYTPKPMPALADDLPPASY